MLKQVLGGFLLKDSSGSRKINKWLFSVLNITNVFLAALFILLEEFQIQKLGKQYILISILVSITQILIISVQELSRFYLICFISYYYFLFFADVFESNSQPSCHFSPVCLNMHLCISFVVFCFFLNILYYSSSRVVVVWKLLWDTAQCRRPIFLPLRGNN